MNRLLEDRLQELRVGAYLMIWHKAADRCHRTTQGDLQKIDWVAELLVLRSRCGLGDQVVSFDDIDDIHNGQATCPDVKPDFRSGSSVGTLPTYVVGDDAGVRTKI